MNKAIVKKGNIQRLFDLVISSIDTNNLVCPTDNILNIQHINPSTLSLEYLKNNLKYYICEYMSISRKVVENKETRKDSRKYYILRSLIRQCFQRVVVEDLDYTVQEKLDDLYLLSVVLDISGFHSTLQTLKEEEMDRASFLSFIKTQFAKAKNLSSTIMLHYNIDLTLFDGFHTPNLSEVQQKVLSVLSKLFILLECYDFEIQSLEEGKVSHTFRIPYTLQAVNFSPASDFPHLFLGCAYHYIKNPLACIFHMEQANELCNYLAYYRSEYIRLRTDELSGIQDNEHLNQIHPLRVCRMYIYCFLHLVEIAVMRVGIHDADYLFQHLRQHFEQVLLTSSEMSKLSDNTLMYIVLISILTIENSFYMDTSVASEPFAHLDKEHNLYSLQLLWYVLTDFMHTYCSHERMQSKLLLPILTGLYYLFSHKELLSFSWDTSSVYPISQSSFLNSIQSFINEVRSTDWSSFTFHDIKLLLSYNSSEFPFAVTHLNSLSCLNGMKERLLQLYPSFSPFVQEIVSTYDSVISLIPQTTEESDSSSDDFLSMINGDIFSDNKTDSSEREANRMKKHFRRLQGRKMKSLRQEVKQPQWRAQRFRKAIPPTKDEFKLLQEVNRTNINNSFIIVLDISNIAVNYGNQHYCCKGIKLAIDYFTSIGHKVIGFMHRKFVDGIKKKNPSYYERMTPDDIPYLKEQIEKRIICTCPDYEDAYILQYAIEHRGIVVSNDYFRDFPKRYPYHLQSIMQRFLDTHVMHYAFTEDSFCPSKEFIYPDLIEDDVSEEEKLQNDPVQSGESEEELQDYPDLGKRVSDERAYYYDNREDEFD